MIRISRVSKLTGVALAMALVAAACGGDSTSSDTAAQAMNEVQSAEADAGNALTEAQAAAAAAASALAAAEAAQAAADLAQATAEGNQDAVAAAEAALQEAQAAADEARTEAAAAQTEADEARAAAEAAGEAAAAAGEEPMDEPMDDATDDMEGTLVPGQPDINGDGEVRIGVASPGDTNDGGFYQSFVDGARAVADELGWTVIVSDFINPVDAETALADLARQNLDFLAVGATELQDGIDAIACEEEFEHIAFYLNGTLTDAHPCYGQSSDDYFEIHWLLGVATAQLLERTGATTAGFIGGPELAFVVVAAKSMEAGLQSINPDYEMVVTYTGDFNDAALGIEAARAMLDQDINVIHTFLGGAMFPTGGFIAENAGMALSASANTCFPGSPFAGASLFPPGAYLAANLRDFNAGTFREGVIRPFKVGIDPEVGAVLCDPTDEEQATIDEVVARMGSGELIAAELVDLSG